MTVSLLFNFLPRRPGLLKKVSLPLPERLLAAFSGSSYDLFLSATLLNVGVQVSVGQFTIRRLTHNTDYDSQNTVYDEPLFLLASALVFLPILIVAPILERNGRRREIIFGILAILWMLFAFPVLAATGLRYNIFETYPNIVDYSGLPFMTFSRGMWFSDQYCSPELDFRSPLYHVILACVVAFVILPPVWICLLGTSWCIRHVRRRRGYIDFDGFLGRMCLQASRCIVAILTIAGLIGMWTSLAAIVIIRENVVKPEGTYPSDRRPEDQWDLGQIIAVAVWIPALIEFFYILFCECGFACSFREYILIYFRRDETGLGRAASTRQSGSR